MFGVCFAVVICSIFFTKVTFAEQYQLKLIADFNQLNDVSSNSSWLDPLASPIDGEFFIARNNGLVYLLGGNKQDKQKIVLNLPQEFKQSASFVLTAMSLHPSFMLPEEAGYATFYTAHTTEFNTQKYTNQITLLDNNFDFALETVITAWKYDFDNQTIEANTQREVLRIPITSQENAIQQLSFEPYLKPWNADYGQLYFSLGYIKELKDQALYSGSILRISPLLFGSRNYTVSQANPFLKEPEINDEIVVMGGQNIDKFFWAKYSYESIFVQHINSEQQQGLSKAKIGVNLSDQTQTVNFGPQPDEMSSTMLYQGRNVLHLRNKMVFFSLLDNQWQLFSIGLESLNTDSPKFEVAISFEGISPSSFLTVHQDIQNEIIVFDKNQNRLYSLQSTPEKMVKEDVSESSTADFGAQYLVLFICLLTLLFSGLIFIYRKNSTYKLAIYPLDKGYVRFEYQLRKDTILLFKINHKKAHKTLYLKDISCCEILLNNDSISIIDDKPENTISNKIEAEIRANFTKEQSKTMFEGQTRQIEIKLSDMNGSYTICLYLRKGNNRVTGTKYYRAVDILIDLCWIISKRLNSQTETRIAPVVAFARPNLSLKTSTTVNKNDTDNNLPKSKQSETNFEEPTTSDKVTQQSDVVEALEKLVKLHKQGYLTDEEFSLAKSNLLK